VLQSIAVFREIATHLQDLSHDPFLTLSVCREVKLPNLSLLHF